MKKRIDFKNSMEAVTNLDQWVMSDKRGTNESFLEKESLPKVPSKNEPILKSLTIKLTEEFYEKFRLHCFKKKTNMSQEIRRIIENLEI